LAGAVCETSVLAEILKSWWHRLREPALWFYRDRDRREVDLGFERDGRLFPVAIKLAASPRTRGAQAFAALDRFPGARAEGALVCLAPTPMPLDRQTVVVPVGHL
jgi:hypothetical protein